MIENTIKIKNVICLGNLRIESLENLDKLYEILDKILSKHSNFVDKGVIEVIHKDEEESY